MCCNDVPFRNFVFKHAGGINAAEVGVRTSGRSLQQAAASRAESDRLGEWKLRGAYLSCALFFLEFTVYVLVFWSTMQFGVIDAWNGAACASSLLSLFYFPAALSTRYGPGGRSSVFPVPARWTVMDRQPWRGQKLTSVKAASTFYIFFDHQEWLHYSHADLVLPV